MWTAVRAPRRFLGRVRAKISALKSNKSRVLQWGTSQKQCLALRQNLDSAVTNCLKNHQLKASTRTDLQMRANQARIWFETVSTWTLKKWTTSPSRRMTIVAWPTRRCAQSLIMTKSWTCPPYLRSSFSQHHPSKSPLQSRFQNSRHLTVYQEFRPAQVTRLIKVQEVCVDKGLAWAPRVPTTIFLSHVRALPWIAATQEEKAPPWGALAVSLAPAQRAKSLHHSPGWPWKAQWRWALFKTWTWMTKLWPKWKLWSTSNRPCFKKRWNWPTRLSWKKRQLLPNRMPSNLSNSQARTSKMLSPKKWGPF